MAISPVKVDAGPGPEWREAMGWLRENTSEPVDSKTSYFDRYPPGYPTPKYGVATWWDYGHLVIALGRRPPSANGFQARAGASGHSYLAPSPDDGANLANRLRLRYVLTDPDLVMPPSGRLTSFNGKMRAMAARLRITFDKYARMFYQEKGGRLEPLLGFTPDYFQTMLVRLQAFDGQTQPGNSVKVGMWRDSDFNRQYYRRAVSVLDFESHGEAQVYIRGGSEKGFTIVSLDPNQSCIRLEKLENYKLVRGGHVKIFKNLHYEEPVEQP